jgi:hypothetical protein
VSKGVLLDLGEVVKHECFGFFEAARGIAQFWRDQLERID